MFNKRKITVSPDENIDELSMFSDDNYDWHKHEPEGQLAVDIAQTDGEIIVIAPMAGTPPDKVGLHLHNDLLTIRGERLSPIDDNMAEHYHQESYWGRFSRTIVLPTEVRYELAQAEYKYGILTIRLPKRKAEEKIRILVVDE